MKSVEVSLVWKCGWVRKSDEDMGTVPNNRLQPRLANKEAR